MRIIELQSEEIIQLSNEVFATLDNPIDYCKGIAVWDLITLPTDFISRAQQIFPWLSGKISVLFIQPNSHTPIHADNHDGIQYYHSLNILIEPNNGNHKTYYYDYVGGWDIRQRGTIWGWGNEYTGTESEIKRTYETTITGPTIFYNQPLHSVVNFEGVTRVAMCWQIHKSIDLNMIKEWLDTNRIGYVVKL